MNIFIDESGSFVNATKHGAWNSVAAYATPEPDRKIKTVLNRLKRSCKGNSFHEIKLKNVQEYDYFHFLQNLGELEGVLFCTATDAGCNDLDTLRAHQQHQSEGVLIHINKMKYESGKEALRILAEQLKGLSPQLYAQLHCQVNLIFDTVSRLIPYFVQRNPTALRSFRWRIDQKNVSKTDFEDAFEKITPALIQTRSFEEPLTMIKGFDYSFLSPFMYEEGQPEYLREIYGLEINSGLNIQKVLREDLKFSDSKDSVGIQVADLLASGIRRCLRGGFNENSKAAFLLGKLMVQAVHNKPPINLIAFRDRIVDELHARDAVRIMIRSCNPMIKRANMRVQN